MQFELTKDYLASLKEAIESSNKEFLEAELAKLHAADIAEILDELSTKKAKHLFELIEEEKSADVLVELEDDVREEILKVLSSEEIADQVIDNIDSDDAADVIAELPDDIQVQVIAKIEEEDPEQASDIVDLLNYDEDTAGGLMAKEMVVVTGGGPGVMEAGNRGAADAGAPSIGLNIVLPHEQAPNEYVTPELCFNFHYFAIRKMHFLVRAKAIAVFPGGFGTMDEMFEALTLIQTHRMERVPFLLFGKKFWNEVINFKALADAGTISPDDVNLFNIVDTAEEGWDLIKGHYNLSM